ncbi:MAG: hypothetical protein ACRD4G_15255, partial [Bryobacteraceae bacterium]
MAAIACDRSLINYPLAGSAIPESRKGLPDFELDPPVTVDQFEIRSRWQPVRRWSIKIEVSNMTMPLTVSRKGKLARVLFHQFLEPPECYDFPKRSVNGFGA